MQQLVKQYQRELIYIGIAIALFVAYRIYKTRKIRKLVLDTLPDAPAPRAGFNTEAEAKMIFDELSAWNVDNTRRANVFEHILGYSDNELILVHNAYLKLFQSESKKTLAELIRGEWIWTFWGRSGEYRDEILLRLRNLGAA